MNASSKWSRRSFVAGTLATAVGMMAGAAAASAEEITLRKPSDPWKGLKIGAATYTFNKLSLEQAIKATARIGLAYCSIKDMHLPMKSTTEERKETVAKFKAAGITPISVGVVTLKNDEAQLRDCFQYAKDVGVPVMVCSPDPAALPLCDKLVKEYDIKLAIHNHGPEDKKFPSPYDVFSAVEKLDPRIGCCIDVGHAARARADPATAIEKIGPRVYDIHLKDLARIDRRSIPVECGRGVLDIRGILAALLKINFAGHAGFEHEKDANDVIPGIAECVGYVRGTLAGM
jgi:sugar phosphate isomerase/epimerase